MSLTTPSNIRELQRKLYSKAKQEPNYRFYSLYDKIYREDILAHAYELAKANQGAPGTDNQSFEEIESGGRQKWWAGLREELCKNVPAPTGATGDDPEGQWRRTATGYPDHSGPGGADRSQTGVGADLRGGSGAERLRI